MCEEAICDKTKNLIIEKRIHTLLQARQQILEEVMNTPMSICEGSRPYYTALEEAFAACIKADAAQIKVGDVEKSCCPS